jgi:hypothetical protein
MSEIPGQSGHALPNLLRPTRAKAEHRDLAWPLSEQDRWSGMPMLHFTPAAALILYPPPHR